MAIRKIPAGETDYAVPPGRTLQETLEHIDMTQKEFANRMGMAPKTINEIIKGKAPITAETAIKLETVLGISAAFWTAMEANYRTDKARLENKKKIALEQEIAGEFRCYAEMSRLGWVEPTRAKGEKVEFLRSFFGVASLENIRVLPYTANFRLKESPRTSFYAIMAWLRQGERMAADIRTEPFSLEKLHDAIPRLRSLTSCRPGFWEKIVSLCAGCGVAVSFVPSLKGAAINGAMRWLSPKKALVTVSLRHAYSDIFWFSLFHELGHIIKGHQKSEPYISYLQSSVRSKQESEADMYARDVLIPPASFDSFLCKRIFTRSSIADFSKEIQIHPGIVWGRLAKENFVKWEEAAPHRLKLKFAS